MVAPRQNAGGQGPLSNLEDWDDDLKRRYPQSQGNPASVASPHRDTEPETKEKPAEAFRDYESDVRPSVREFYRQNHAYQTVEFNRAKRAEYLPLRKRKMKFWEAIEYLNQLVDDSDPDTDLPQIEHALQTSEAIRGDGQPRWMILTGLIHDMGKVLCLFDEPQWAVVGDTFPVGCRFSDKIVLPGYFELNPDSQVSAYQTPLGIYEEGRGLDSVMMSWGHDEYLYQVTKDYLPEEALYIIRYHSCYPIHREGQYDYLMNDHDREMFRWVRRFNPYDLYTKSHGRLDVESLLPFYRELVSEFLPETLAW